MIDYHAALEIIISAAIRLETEKTGLRDSCGRVLAMEVFHDRDMPPFHKSAMDGYACRRTDLGHKMEVVETISAGKAPEKVIGVNQCSKIMTGAVVPESADCVFKKEDAVITAEGKVVCTNLSSGNNICYMGEDIKAGEKVLNSSTLLTARHLPILAGAGIVSPEVYKQPRVAVFATGTELVEPFEKPLPFQIRNSNSSQLLAQLSSMHIGAYYMGILGDETELLTRRLAETSRSFDITILTGGVSVGDFDLIPEVIQSLGYEILVTSTAIKPGKPMLFAKKGNRYCFGLSGNPVSSFVQFELYVKPFLYALSGHNFQPVVYHFPAATDIRQKDAGRMQFVPVNLTTDMHVMPVDFHGSAHIHALSHAEYLAEIPKGINLIKKGEPVHVRPL